MTKAEFLKRIEELEAVTIHKAVKYERIGVFLPPLSRDYDRGVATLEDGRKVEFAWGGPAGTLSMKSVKAIHALQPDREFVLLNEINELDGTIRNNYAAILFESEK